MGRAMTTWLITRHPGTYEWAISQGMKFDRTMTHVLPEEIVDMINPGDKVYGNLPLYLIASICERGGRYFQLDMRVSESKRGEEMSKQDIEQFKPKFNEYRVERCS